MRSNIAAESRAKIVYEYLKQFTDDPGVQDTLTFLMTREVAHFQQFTAALNELPVNFPPGRLPGDDRFQNLTFNMSDSGSTRGPWNEGQGPCPVGTEWRYVERPTEWIGSAERSNRGGEAGVEGTPAVRGTPPFVHQEHVAVRGAGASR
ncbi:manganese catalase family protein [Dactylosporangium roseum]|uniref:Manganese catalase family protein n=1 Tax=Dactylosporangium roseum TaxID=47989 RepID=A0ABY5ZDS5_9ACTN|nr:manganese catalase family protein [Dactylosporangium roseum]UWZ39736.1 manganese catalase family protein [Dactylosporangium roseum]